MLIQTNNYFVVTKITYRELPGHRQQMADRLK